MGEDGRKCKGTTTSGQPCRSPIVGESGYCNAHDPAEAGRMKILGQLGAEATRRRWLGRGLSADELPELRSPEDVKEWTVLVAQAVASGRISTAQGQALARLLSEWRKAYEDSELVKRIERLEQEQAGRVGEAF